MCIVLSLSPIFTRTARQIGVVPNNLRKKLVIKQDLLVLLEWISPNSIPSKIAFPFLSMMCKGVGLS